LNKNYTIFKILCYKKECQGILLMFPISSSAQHTLVTCLAWDLQVNQASSRRVEFLHEVPWKLYPDDDLE
jgi:hypothetical protein